MRVFSELVAVASVDEDEVFVSKGVQYVKGTKQERRANRQTARTKGLFMGGTKMKGQERVKGGCESARNIHNRSLKITLGN